MGKRDQSLALQAIRKRGRSRHNNVSSNTVCQENQRSHQQDEKSGQTDHEAFTNGSDHAPDAVQESRITRRKVRCARNMEGWSTDTIVMRDYPTTHKTHKTQKPAQELRNTRQRKKSAQQAAPRALSPPCKTTTLHNLERKQYQDKLLY